MGSRNSVFNANVNDSTSRVSGKLPLLATRFSSRHYPHLCQFEGHWKFAAAAVARPGGPIVNSQGRKPLDAGATHRRSPGGAPENPDENRLEIQRAIGLRCAPVGRPCRGFARLLCWFQGLPPLAIDGRPSGSKNKNAISLFSASAAVIAIALAILATASSSYGVEQPGGFGLGPGIVLAENIRPGAEEADLTKAMGDPFTVYNGTDEEHIFRVWVAKPTTAISEWEHGYDEIPDAAWCRLDQKEIKIARKSDAKVNLFIKVPDKPEYYNRKWVVLVMASPSGGGGPGVVGLQIASRVLIETAAKETADGVTADPLSVVPSAIDLAGLPAEFEARQFVTVRNNSKEEHTYTSKRINDLEKDKTKHARYFGKGNTPVVDPSWVKVADNSFTLKPNEAKKLVVSFTIPKTAAADKKYEELVFFQDDKGHEEFVRLRTELASVSANADDGKKQQP